MGKINPLCGTCSLQRGTQILAIIEIVLAVLYLIQNAVALGSYVPRAIEEHSINNEGENWIEKVPRIYSMKTAVTLLDTSYWVCALLLGVLLYFGAKQRDLRKCRQFFIVSCILAVLFTVHIMMVAFSMKFTIAEITSPVVGSFVLSYMICVVLAFIEELRLGRVSFKNELPAA